MPSVFTDEANAYDLTISTAADWTVSSGGLPNGDNYVTGDGTIAATYNTNGDDFDLRDGTAWSIEFWVYFLNPTAGQIILDNSEPGLAGTTRAWTVQITSSEQILFEIVNTVNLSYLTFTTASLTANAWHHVVLIKETGNTIKSYIDDVAGASSSAQSGTARTPGTSHRLYFGVNADGAGDLDGQVRVSKLAIYNKELSLAEINDHYLSMVAT